MTPLLCPSQAPLDVQRDLLPPQLRRHGPAVHPRQCRPQTGEGAALPRGPGLRPQGSAGTLVFPALMQVREMVEIITREFVLMAGTVDVVSTSAVLAGGECGMGAASSGPVLHAHPSSGAAGTVLPAGGGPVLAGVPAEEPPARPPGPAPWRLSHLRRDRRSAPQNKPATRGVCLTFSGWFKFCFRLFFMPYTFSSLVFSWTRAGTNEQVLYTRPRGPCSHTPTGTSSREPGACAVSCGRVLRL